MKISKNTLNILKNFASINPSLYVNEGNIIKTISAQKTIIARAEIKETFENSFGIYDLNQFLSATNIFDSPIFDFKDKFVNIKDDNSIISYTYADPNMILQVPNKELKLPDVVIEFELKCNIFKKTLLAANILQVPYWSVNGDGKKVIIEVSNSKDSSSNKFKYEVGESNREFNLIFKVENLNQRLMNKDDKDNEINYTVKISSKGISHFSANNGKLQYWIATESKG